MSLSRRKRQRSIKKSAPRVTLVAKKKPQGDPSKVTRTVQVASHDFGKSPARVRKAMIEAFRLGGSFIWQLPYSDTHHILCARKGSMVAVALMRNDDTVEKILMRLENNKPNLFGVGHHLFEVANSKELTHAVMHKDSTPDDLDLTRKPVLVESKPDHSGLWVPNG